MPRYVARCSTSNCLWYAVSIWNCSLTWLKSSLKKMPLLTVASSWNATMIITSFAAAEDHQFWVAKRVLTESYARLSHLINVCWLMLLEALWLGSVHHLWRRKIMTQTDSLTLSSRVHLPQWALHKTQCVGVVIKEVSLICKCSQKVEFMILTSF